MRLAYQHLVPLLVVLPVLASAQEDDAVVVTATRAPSPSLQIPVSIDTLEADEIRQGRPQVNLSESLGRVPGIVVQNRQNYAQDLQISSRGFGARSTFGVRGIRLLQDGIPASMPDGQGQVSSFALGSAGRIEVLRGPFSVLHGNAAGGVISIETQDAPQVPALEAGLLAGSWQTWRAALKFGGQWGALNAIGEASRFDTNGYRDHSAAVRDQANARLKYALSDDTRVILVANSLRQPDTLDPLGLTRAQMEANPRQAVAAAYTFNTRKTVLQDQAGVTLQHRLSASTRVEASVYGGQRWFEQYLSIPLAVQAAPTHSGGVVAFDRGYAGTGLRFFTGDEFRIAAGIEYERMAERRRGFVNDNGTREALKRDEHDAASTLGVFGQADWRLDERWSVHGGMRLTSVRFRSTDYFIAAGNPDDSGARDYAAATPVAGVVYRLSPRVSLYGNAGAGFETPTFAELAHQNVGSGLNLALKAARSRHLEGGVKAIFPRLARLNVALFDVATRDEIVVDAAAGGRTTFKNAGRTGRRGLELAAETQVPGAWQAHAAFTHLEAQFKDAFASGATTVPAGNALPGIPATQLAAQVRYNPQGYYFAVESLYRSKVPVNDLNSQHADAYVVANLVAGLQQQGKRWRLSEYLRVDNVADRKYVGSVIVNEGNGRFYEPSPQRSITVGMQASAEF